MDNILSATITGICTIIAAIISAAASIYIYIIGARNGVSPGNPPKVNGFGSSISTSETPANVWAKIFGVMSVFAGTMMFCGSFVFSIPAPTFIVFCCPTLLFSGFAIIFGVVAMWRKEPWIGYVGLVQSGFAFSAAIIIAVLLYFIGSGSLLSK